MKFLLTEVINIQNFEAKRKAKAIKNKNADEMWLERPILCGILRDITVKQQILYFDKNKLRK